MPRRPKTEASEVRRSLRGVAVPRPEAAHPGIRHPAGEEACPRVEVAVAHRDIRHPEGVGEAAEFRR